jgi:hypothetical protein
MRLSSFTRHSRSPVLLGHTEPDVIRVGGGQQPPGGGDDDDRLINLCRETLKKPHPIRDGYAVAEDPITGEIITLCDPETGKPVPAPTMRVFRARLCYALERR